MNEPYFNDVKHKKIFHIKKQLLEENGLNCSHCEKTIYGSKELEVDHIIPICLQGDLHNKSNCQLLCKQCHLKKTIKDKCILYKLIKEIVIEKYFEGWRSIKSKSEIAEIYKQRL